MRGDADQRTGREEGVQIDGNNLDCIVCYIQQKAEQPYQGLRLGRQAIHEWILDLEKEGAYTYELIHVYMRIT